MWDRGAQGFVGKRGVFKLVEFLVIMAEAKPIGEGSKVRLRPRHVQENTRRRPLLSLPFKMTASRFDVFSASESLELMVYACRTNRSS